MKAVFDTNILIDYLLGKLPASNELKQYKNPQISIITKMEILVGTSEDTEEITKKFLDNFTVISLNEEIAEIAVAIRKEYKIKLPDAIIWATAKYNNSLLITRNIKDFPIHASDIKIPYNI
ncbi:type II toxin-antitoxin system VapC family toxin [Rickettsia endosymbiont of Orchestes rusci]|nr:type II toxin-antitoxin system VapC family toxin [Rickettsia endosymbiont of Ceutorhynchus assimilis]